MSIQLNHTIVHSRDPRDAEFDQIFGRIRSRGLLYWSDPGKRHRGEIITKPYGSR